MDLSGAILSRAQLHDVKVSKAKLAYTTLTKAFYAPASEPPDHCVAGIKGLVTIKAGTGEQIGFVQPRKLLQDAGLNNGVRKVTYAIRRNINRDQVSEGLLNLAWIL